VTSAVLHQKSSAMNYPEKNISINSFPTSLCLGLFISKFGVNSFGGTKHSLYQPLLYRPICYFCRGMPMIVSKFQLSSSIELLYESKTTWIFFLIPYKCVSKKYHNVLKASRVLFLQCRNI